MKFGRVFSAIFTTTVPSTPPDTSTTSPGFINFLLLLPELIDTNNFTKYSLKGGQTIVFSAVNQIHWRPKRKFKEGEFCEIISMDYCPTTSYRFTGKDNPIDPEKNKDKRIGINHDGEGARRPIFGIGKDLSIGRIGL